MKIEGIIWLNQIVDKLAFKHQVETYEVEELLSESPNLDLLKKASEKMKMFIWLWGKPSAADI